MTIIIYEVIVIQQLTKNNQNLETDTKCHNTGGIKLKAAGIICEYNPFHNGHEAHIAETKRALGDGCAIVCAMSGNFVQRGEPAIFNKHTRAEAAVRCGADLVLEIPTPYVLTSSQGYAEAGVSILTSLGACEYISFGSESGRIDELSKVAEALSAEKTGMQIKTMLGKGIAYAQAVQMTLDVIMGERAVLLKSPNNLLGIEYIRAINKTGSHIKPITFKRTGGAHDGDSGYSASAIRRLLRGGEFAGGFGSEYGGECGNGFGGGFGNIQETVSEKTLNAIHNTMPEHSIMLCKREISEGRGPVSIESLEQAIMSRLRNINDFSQFPGASEGFGNRFARYAATEPSVAMILNKAKTKRYAMSRIRRMLICACLGITAADTAKPPSYLRVLAANDIGIKLLGELRGNTESPIITKPAQAKHLDAHAAELFKKEAAATDFYVIGYPKIAHREGSAEWRQGPVIVK